MRFLYLFVALLSLSACQSSPDEGGVFGSRAGTTGADLPDPSMIEDVSVDGTTDLLATGVRQISPSVAIQTIDLWLVRLDTVSVEGVPDVRKDLTSLRDLLQSSPLDGRAIGLRLRDLGESTAAFPDSTGRLAPLASALHAAGRRLAPDSTEANSDSVSVQ